MFRKEIKNIEYTLSIKANELNDYRNIISQKVKDTLEKKIFSEKIGYIVKVTKINDIQYLRLDTFYEIGDIVFLATFDAICTLPVVGTTVECSIVTENEDLMFASVGPMHILIINPDEIDVSDIDDTQDVCVKVEMFECDTKKNIIKVVASLDL